MRPPPNACLLAAIVAAALLAFASAVSAANPAAGSDATPKWTSTDQLKTKWGSRSLEELTGEAGKGDAEAQFFMGWRLANGEGVARDEAAAVGWYRKAAELGFALAQNSLGVALQRGSGVAKDAVEAERWMSRAADQGLPVALRNLGNLLKDGKSLGTQDPEKAAGVLQRAENQRLPLTQASYGLLPRPADSHVYFGKTSQSIRMGEACRLYELAAERGDMEAAIALARAHLYGEGGFLGGNSDVGIYWLSFAEEKGHAGACNQIGWLYMNGLYVPRDRKEARHWFMKGAEQGEPSSELSMGMYELLTFEKTPDLAAARGWMLKAADKNLQQAFFQLGRISELWDIPHGPEVNPNYEEAAKWYQRATDAGSKAAARRLLDLLTMRKAGSITNVVAMLQRASDLEDYTARLDLAKRYFRGEAKPRNTEDAPQALMASLVLIGNSDALVQLAEFHRTGQHVPKDSLAALYLLHGAAIRGSFEARQRFTQLRAALRDKQPIPELCLGLEAAYPLYMEAEFGKAAEPAAQIARGYLEGDSASDVRAYAWFALAAKRGDTVAAAEQQRLSNKLAGTMKLEAERMAKDLIELVGFGFPGF